MQVFRTWLESGKTKVRKNRRCWTKVFTVLWYNIYNTVNSSWIELLGPEKSLSHASWFNSVDKRSRWSHNEIRFPTGKFVLLTTSDIRNYVRYMKRSLHSVCTTSRLLRMLEYQTGRMQEANQFLELPISLGAAVPQTPFFHTPRPFVRWPIGQLVVAADVRRDLPAAAVFSRPVSRQIRRRSEAGTGAVYTRTWLDHVATWPA